MGAISPLLHNVFYLLLDFLVKAGTRFSLRDKRLFEISEVEITRVNCIYIFSRGLDTHRKCNAMVFKGDNFCVLLSYTTPAFEKASTSKGKYLLPKFC